MKHYTSFESIERDLKQYKLEQSIALEELKLTKNELAEQFTVPSWLGSLGKGAAKYGFFFIMKRWLRKI